jgi:hypothetical protein
LVVVGGVGIGKDLQVGGNLYTTGTIYANTIYTGVWALTTATSFTGGTIPNSVLISSSTQATSTSTGSLVVVGGVGIGGNLYVGGTISIGTGSSSISGIASLSAGVITVTSTATSTGTNTGALVVAGGVGIGGATYIAATSYVAGAQIITTATLGNYAASFLGGSVPFAVNITSSTQATSTSTGSLVVVGGVGIGKDLQVGGNLYTTGTIYSGPWAVNTSTLSVSTATFATYETVVASPTSTFTIPGGYQIGQIQVAANGIILGSGDYTASNGTTVVVNRTRNIGDVIRVTGMSGQWATATTYAFVATEVTASSNGQTTFTVSYNTASTQVYLNGVLLNTADYTANNGTTIVLVSGTGVQIGHIMRVLSYNLYNISGALSLSGGTVNGTVNVTGTLKQNGNSINAISAAMSIALGM